MTGAGIDVDVHGKAGVDIDAEVEALLAKALLVEDLPRESEERGGYRGYEKQNGRKKK